MLKFLTRCTIVHGCNIRLNPTRKDVSRNRPKKKCWNFFKHSNKKFAGLKFYVFLLAVFLFSCPASILKFKGKRPRFRLHFLRYFCYSSPPHPWCTGTCDFWGSDKIWQATAYQLPGLPYPSCLDISYNMFRCRCQPQIEVLVMQCIEQCEDRFEESQWQ